MQQVQHEGLEQGCFGFFPEWVGALGVGRRGVLNQIFNQGQYFTVIMYIHKRVVTERCGRVYEIKYDNLISLLLQQIAGFTQNFRLWVSDYHRADTFQYIRHTIGARLACAGAADNQDVGVVLMFVAVDSNVEMLGQQQVRPVPVHVELIQPKHIAQPPSHALRRGGCSSDPSRPR